MGSTDRASGGIAVSVLLVLIGITLIVLGSVQLTTLAGAYRNTDIVLTETPLSFHAWMAGLAQDVEGSDRADNSSLSRRIADRLVIMPLPARRRVIIQLARSEFWDDMAADISKQRTIMAVALDGVLLALKTEPSAGDLYFCAAWLETTLHGWGERPRRLLEASLVFSPYELDIAIERLILAPLIWRFLQVDDKVRLKKDFEYVTRTFPDSTPQIIKELDEQGISFD